jgi:hypothetical protein
MCVLSPIELDDQAVFPAHEVNDIQPDRKLPMKLTPAEAAIAQP